MEGMSTPEGGKGAKRRSGIPTPLQRAAPEVRRLVEDGRDSGLSSECTTPTNGSPAPRQTRQEQPAAAATNVAGQIPRRRMSDIIAASKARLQESQRLNSNRTSRLLQSRSSTDSPKSLDSTRSRQLFSPLRPPRTGQSPSLDSGDEGSLRMERGTYSYMFQDIVSIKTMLLKLKRVLQESGENGLTRDTLNPFDNSLKNGLFYNLNDGNATTDTTTSPNDGRETVADELADLRRQVVFLQGQLDDKDRTIQTLQAQLNKFQNANKTDSAIDVSSTTNDRDELKETSNAATQTEKLRPVSAGPSMLQGLPQDNGMGPLVSLNESWSGYHQQQHQHQQQQQQQHRPGEPGSPSLSKPSSRRASSEQQRPSSLRGLRPPSTTGLPTPSPEDSPKLRAGRNRFSEVDAVTPTTPPTSATRSAIPTPRRLATPTLIPRSARAVSATGRAHNS